MANSSVNTLSKAPGIFTKILHASLFYCKIFTTGHTTVVNMNDISYLLSAICYLLSAISNQISAIGCQQSDISNQSRFHITQHFGNHKLAWAIGGIILLPVGILALITCVANKLLAYRSVKQLQSLERDIFSLCQNATVNEIEQICTDYIRNPTDEYVKQSMINILRYGRQELTLGILIKIVYGEMLPNYDALDALTKLTSMQDCPVIYRELVERQNGMFAGQQYLHIHELLQPGAQPANLDFLKNFDLSLFLALNAFTDKDLGTISQHQNAPEICKKAAKFIVEIRSNIQQLSSEKLMEMLGYGTIEELMETLGCGTIERLVSDGHNEATRILRRFCLLAADAELKTNPDRLPFYLANKERISNMFSHYQQPVRYAYQR